MVDRSNKMNKAKLPFKDSERLRWVYDGQIVTAPYDNKGTGIRCVVEKACGTQAYVVNKKHKFARWFDVLDLFPDFVGR